MTADMLLYACLHAQPSAAYQAYVAETLPAYSGMFGFVFVENAISALTLILCGLIPFGIGVLPVVCFTLNGLVSTAKGLLTTVSGKELLVCTLPHGALEGAALLMTIMLSCLLSRAITLALVKAAKRQPFFRELKAELHHIGAFVLLLVIPLLFCGAIIETQISRYLIM